MSSSATPLDNAMMDDLEPGEIREEGSSGPPPAASRPMTKGERRRARKAAIIANETPEQRTARLQDAQAHRRKSKAKRRAKAQRREDETKKSRVDEKKPTGGAQSASAQKWEELRKNQSDKKRRQEEAERLKEDRRQAKLEEWKKASYWIPMPGARVGFKDLAEETISDIAKLVGEWDGGGITGPARDLYSLMRVSKATVLPAGMELYRGHAYLDRKMTLSRLLTGIVPVESSAEAISRPYGSTLKLALLKAIPEMEYQMPWHSGLEMVKHDTALLNRLAPDLHVLALDNVKMYLPRGEVSPDFVGALVPRITVKRICYEVDYHTPIEDLRKPYTLRFAGGHLPEVVISHAIDLLRPVPVCHGTRNVINVFPSEVQELPLERRVELLVEMIKSHQASAPGDLENATTYELVNVGFSLPPEDDLEDLDDYDGPAAHRVSNHEKIQTAQLAKMLFEQLPEMEGKIKFEQAWDTTRENSYEYTAQCELCGDELGWSPEDLWGGCH